MVDTMSEYKEISLTDEEAEDILTAPVEEFDPEAPYGRLKNGKPRKHPVKSAAQSYAAPQAPDKKRGRPAAKSKGPSYTEKAAGLLSLPMIGLGLVASATGSPSLEADAATMVLYQPSLSQALGDLAETKPEFAAVLDKMTGVGPYGALVMVALPMTLQMLANHKIVKPVEQLGVLSPEDVLKLAAEKAPQEKAAA